jgi:hypothetical protein
MNASTRKIGRSYHWNGVEVEGAKGGSYVRIEGNDTENSCDISVGHSCVTTVSCTIPVTWLAAILTHAKDIGFVNAMGDVGKFPADYALMCDPEPGDVP